MEIDKIVEQIFPHIIHSIPTVRTHFNILWNTLIFSSEYLRNMMEVANSNPAAGTFLKLGILSINFEIDFRKLKFLWKILQKENDDPVNKFIWN